MQSNYRNVAMISILLVDDETELLDFTRLYLEDQRGFRVQTASCAKEALHLMQENFPRPLKNKTSGTKCIR